MHHLKLLTLKLVFMAQKKPRPKPKATESKVTYPAIVVDSKSKRLKKGSLTYDYPDDNSVPEYGRYISIDAANLLVNTLRESLKKGKINDKATWSVTFGIDHILSILAQKDCEGIRFYFAERKAEHWERGSEYAEHEGLTLVAVGVDINNKDLGTDGGYIIHDMPGNKKGKTKSAAAASAKDSNTKVVEVVPPEP
jgi:hypothetical protein